MVKSSKMLILQELYYYYYYLFLLKKLNYSLIFKQNNFNRILINFINFQKNATCSNLVADYWNQSATKLLQQDYIVNYQFFKCKPNQLTKLTTSKSKSFFKFFSLFTLFNLSLFNSHFRFNSKLKLFYIALLDKSLIVLNFKVLALRWQDGFSLLFNIFFYNYTPIIYGSFFFKTELLALNWNYSHFNLNLWRYYFPFSIFKPNSYNHKLSYYFGKLAQQGVDFYIVTDCSYHYKNIYYMKKKLLYSVGLINLNINPWLVVYPIISFFDSYVTQSFFFKLLLCEERRARFIHFNYFKKIWFLYKYSFKMCIRPLLNLLLILNS